MAFVNNNHSLAMVPYVRQSDVAEQSQVCAHEPIKARVQRVMDSFCAHMKSLEENRYLSTYKALQLGGKETMESRMIRSAIAICPTHSEEETALRLFNYNKATQYLSHLTDENLSELLTTATPLGSGIGGEVLSMEVEGVPLFVKKIRLTPIEQQHLGSTLNLFELPSYYQYGVGSMGFGVWREISAHEMTTQWVLNGECQNFPLMYHYRALQRSTPPTMPTSEQLEERQRYVDDWNGSSTVGIRAQAADLASADVVVFMENFPQTLYKWLKAEGDKGNLTEQSIANLERELNMVTAFMKSRGFLHFDAHFHNILASNDHVYFADFGLAMSHKFDCSLEEMTFFEKHSSYDRYYVVSELVKNAIAATVHEGSEVLLNAYLSTEKMTTTLPSAVASIAERYRPIAVLMDKFFQGLRKESKSTPYPEAELSREWAKLQDM
ncbi:MAG: protein kinase family protein [Parachlamydiaceae bacterium]|nr:protein kinase family protein [Parachlamydiaceae bacterium]